jgi:hypothetical protein
MHLKELSKEIYYLKEDNRDRKYICDYQKFLPHDDLNDFDQAMKNVYSHEKYEKFIKQLKRRGINALICGSYGLSCVYKKNKIVPNDLDMCVKNVNRNTLIQIENIIRNVYPNKKLIVLRNLFMMTFFIFDETDVFTIQVHITDITAWSEIFVMVASDITCIGFEVLTETFVCLERRWKNLLNDETITFTNIMNFDSRDSLSNAYEKYKSRGFKCAMEFFSEPIHLIYRIYQICGDCGSSIEKTDSIIDTITSKYRGKTYVCFSNTVKSIFFNVELIPHIKCLSLININPESKRTNEVAKIFLTRALEIKFKDGYFYDNKYFTVGIKCNNCDHALSLNEFCKRRQKSCRCECINQYSLLIY